MLTMTGEKKRFLSLVADRQLSKMSIFKSCSNVDLQRIEKYMVEKHLARNQAIFCPEEPAEKIWFVKSGYIKEVDHSIKGRSHIVSLVGAEGMFGTSSFNGGTYGCYALSETKAEVIAFPIGVFQSFVDKHADVGREVLRRLSKYLLEAKRMRMVATDRVEKRILHALVHLREQFGDTIRLTRKEIGEVAGANTETVIRMFAKIKMKGLINVGRGRVTVPDVNKLIARMSEL